MAALTKARIRECDGPHCAVAWLDSELAVEREAKCVAEGRAEASRQKAMEAEEAHWTTEGMVTELRVP